MSVDTENMETNQATQAEVVEFLAEAKAAGRSAFDHYFATNTLADIAARIAANAREYDASNATEKRGSHGRKFRG